MTGMPDGAAARLLLDNLGFLRRIAGGLVRDDALAADLAQDASLVALQAAPRDATRFRPWLRRVTQNLALQEWRGRARRERREATAAPAAPAESAERIAERKEVLRGVVDAVLALDEPFATTIIEHYCEGRDVRDIARRAGVAEATVRTRLHRGLTDLRGRLDRQFGGRAIWALPLGFAAPAVHASLSPAVIAACALLLIGSGAAAFHLTRQGSERPAPIAAQAAPPARPQEAEAAGAAALPGAAPAPRAAQKSAPAMAVPDETPPPDRPCRAVNADGAPVAGAEIRWAPFHSLPESLRFRLVSGEPAAEEEFVKRSTRIVSGPDGSFVLPLVDGSLTVMASAEGGLFARRTIPGAKAAPGPTKLTLRPDRAGRIEVRDAGSTRPAGVPVVIRSSADSPTFMWAGTTDANGVVSIPHLDAVFDDDADGVAMFDLPLTAPRRAAVTAERLSGGGIGLELLPTATLAVRVRDPRGGPVPAKVVLLDGRRLPFEVHPRREARAGADGAASFPRVGLGASFRVRIEDPARRWAPVEVEASAPEEAGATAELGVAFGEEARVATVVLKDAVRGALCADAHLVSSTIFRGGSRAAFIKGEVFTDGEGRVVLDSKRNGPEAGEERWVFKRLDRYGRTAAEGELVLSEPLPPGRTDLGVVELRAPAAPK